MKEKIYYPNLNHDEKKFNLIIATDNFLPRKDGITRFLNTIIPKLKESFNLTIICPDFEENNVDIEGVKFIRIPFNKKYYGDFKPVKFNSKPIKRALINADLVFSQTLGPIGFMTLYYAQKRRIKTTAFIHSIDWKLISSFANTYILRKILELFSKKIAKYIYKKCNYLIMPADVISEIFNWENITTPKKVIHLGVDSKMFIPYYQNSSREEIRKMFEISDDDLVIGYHGRISKEKDLYTLLRAFVHLRNKYNNLKLMIVGSGIPSIVSDFAKQKKVIHIPATSEVANFLSAMDIYCLPSITETTSLSTLEAMSCSLPVVSTGVGFIKEYIKNNDNGYFFKKRDSYDLARKIENLIKNKDKRISFGEKSRKIVVEKFKWENTILELNNFLLDLIKKEQNQIKEIDEMI